jgi:hypothetical protein
MCHRIPAANVPNCIEPVVFVPVTVRLSSTLGSRPAASRPVPYLRGFCPAQMSTICPGMVSPVDNLVMKPLAVFSNDVTLASYTTFASFDVRAVAILLPASGSKFGSKDAFDPRIVTLEPSERNTAVIRCPQRRLQG